MATTELERERPGDEPPRRPPSPAAPPRVRPLAAGKVALVGGSALVLAALLNSASLLALAEQQPEGSRVRSVALAVAEPLDDLASAVGLDRPRQVVDEWLGRDEPSDDGDIVVAGAAAPTTVVHRRGRPRRRLPRRRPSPPATDAPAPPPLAPTTVAPTTTTTPVVVNSKVLIAGDSMSQGVGVMLEAFAAEKGLQVESIGKASTGLTRPDYFDWPARLLEATAASDPGVVVLMFGGNDGQPITDAAGKAYQVADPEWAVEYGSRVAHVMDQLGAEGRKVVWIGSPNSSSSNMNKRLTVINQVLQQQAATRPWVTYLDAWALFAAPDGSFVASLPDADGQVRRMRNKDGYHLTIDGYKYLARAALTSVEQARAG